MADSISIVMKLNEDVTGKMKSIASASKSVSKEFEEQQRKAQQLGQRYDAFNKKAADASAEAISVKKAMQDAAAAFKKTGDEADRVRFTNLKSEYDALTESAKEYSKQAKDTMKDIDNVYQAMRKQSDMSGSVSSSESGGFLAAVFGNDLGGKLAQSGIFKMLGDTATNGIGAFVESTIGQPLATLGSSIASGIASGAAAGAVAGIPAIGAAVGGIAGVVSGATQMFTAKDDAFKSYVQDAYQNQLSEQESSLKTGSSIAAGRETDRISFATLFGGAGVAEKYLKDLVKMSNNTPFLYDDLTAMSKTLATYQYGADEILPVLKTIGDTGAALGQSTSDMTMVATALGRMKSSNKTSLEYLNILNDRGIGAVGMLADAYGVDQGTMYDMISKGKIEGTKAAEIILQAMTDSFAGSMENQSKTYSGLTSTVEGLTQELDNAMGEGYNEGRMAGLQAQRDWLSGESGAAVQEANKAIGAWKAELENSKEQYIRDAVDAMMASDEYKTAKASGDAAEMGRLIMEAKVQGMDEYNASDGAQLALESEKKLVDAIRNDTSLNQDYWDAGYEKGNWFTKGLAASINNKHGGFSSYEDAVIATGGDAGVLEAIGAYDGSHAFGLKRVPYDGYRAILHEGERVMTAAENRSSTERSVIVQVSGNEFVVRGEDDIDAIARQIAVRVREAKETYGG